MNLRRAEWALLALGLALRLLAPFTFDVHGGGDFWNHEHYVRWMTYAEWPPPISFTMEGFHPPGYYWLAAHILSRFDDQALIWVSVLAGCIRLGLTTLGLRMIFPTRPIVRVVALGIAALLPASLQIDMMVSGESLLAMLSVAALVLILYGLGLGSGLDASPRRRLLSALGAGLVIGVAFWVKLSALILAGGLGLAAVLEVWSSSGRPLARFGRAAPWLWALILALLIATPQFVANQRAWHHWFPSSFDTTQVKLQRRILGVDFIHRRPLEFYYKWDASLFAYPFATSDHNVESRFWPTLVASTFVDYYSFHFVWPPPTDDKPPNVNYRPMPRVAFWPARLSFAGGTFLALVVSVTGVLVLASALRRRDVIALCALGIFVAALLGQIQFAIQYPFDDYGVIKGQYLQFAAAPVYAFSGIAVEHCWQSHRRALAIAILVALALVAFYTLFARGVALLHPL